MNSQELVDTMFEKVNTTMGLAFVYADDYVWLFKDGKLINYGHTLSSGQVLKSLDIPFSAFSFDSNQEEAAEIFDSVLDKRI